MCTKRDSATAAIRRVAWTVATESRTPAVRTRFCGGRTCAPAEHREICQLAEDRLECRSNRLRYWNGSEAHSERARRHPASWHVQGNGLPRRGQVHTQLNPTSVATLVSRSGSTHQKDINARLR